MKNQVAYIFLLVFAVLFFSRCANQVAPTGGAKDTTPPKVLGTYPLNKSLRFSDKKIRILFDEYINIENATQQVVISPPMQPFPEFQVKGKELVITFKDSLRSNTTYTINISAAVKDITENNAVPDFQYVFSTGEFLDSFFITGKVVDAEKGLPAEDVLVMLYDHMEDSVVYKEKPYYFGRTDKSGSYRIENIKGGTYKLFAVKDGNFNLKYDLPNEAIAFLEQPITITDSVLPPIDLKLFTEETKKLQMVENNTLNRGFNQFVYSMPVKTLEIRPVLDSTNFAQSLIEYNVSRDTITQWYLYNNNSRSIILVTANDTLTDSITVRSPVFTADSLYKIGKPGLYAPVATSNRKGVGAKSSSAPVPTVLELGEPFVFALNRPVSSLDSSKIYVLEDTVNPVVPRVYFADSINRKVAVDYKWKPGATYTIVFLDSAITDRYGLKNDSLGFELTARKPDEYGALTVTIDSLDPSQQYILEASIGEGPVVFRAVITGQTQFVKKYEKLVAGGYKVRIIRDANFNGKWDTGNYMEKRQPERIFVYPSDVAMKANWEMEIEIEMDR